MAIQNTLTTLNLQMLQLFQGENFDFSDLSTGRVGLILDTINLPYFQRNITVDDITSRMQFADVPLDMIIFLIVSNYCFMLKYLIWYERNEFYTYKNSCLCFTSLTWLFEKGM